MSCSLMVIEDNWNSDAMSDSDMLNSNTDVCGGACSGSSSSSISLRTPPNCVRCHNHGLKITLKAHKRYCKYRYCTCEKCRLTADRQLVMARQTALRRAHALDEQRSVSSVGGGGGVGSMVSETGPTISSVPAPQTVHHINTVPTTAQSLEGSSDTLSLTSYSTSVAVLPIAIVGHKPPLHPNRENIHLAQDVFLEHCQKLLEKFRYPWEMMPLMYVILKDAGADIEEASRRIEEGQHVVNEYSRHHNLYIYDGGELRSTTSQCG